MVVIIYIIKEKNLSEEAGKILDLMEFKVLEMKEKVITSGNRVIIGLTQIMMVWLIT